MKPRARLRLALLVLWLSLQSALPGFAGAEGVLPISSTVAPRSDPARVEGGMASLPLATGSPALAPSDASGVEVGPQGGTVDLPGSGEMVIPAGALAAPARISRYSVETSQATSLLRYHPLGQAVRIEAKRSDNGAAVTRLQRPATVRLKLDGPEIPKGFADKAAVRVAGARDWELLPASYDSASMAFNVSLTDLPITLALVDGSKPPGLGAWDPVDPAAVQLSDGSWGVAYTDAANPPHLLYRRSLEDPGALYWLDPVTIDTGASYSDTPVPALVRLDSTLALFYRKTDVITRQVILRTSTDDGTTWSSSPITLTSEITNTYQIQASNVGGTVYVFWSLDDDSHLLQLRTSTDLANWTTKASVGQQIGPQELATHPDFDITKLSSGAWVLTWLNPATCTTGSPPCTQNDQQTVGNHSWPVVWEATSTDLSSTNWSNKQELTRPWSSCPPPQESCAGNYLSPKYVSLRQAGSGTVYLAHNFTVQSSDSFGYFRTSTDNGATWSSETVYAFEPSRGTTLPQLKGVKAWDLYLAVDGSGNVRSFWDQQSVDFSSYTDGHPRQIFFRDLPSGAITPIPATKEVLSKCGPCDGSTFYTADPVNTTTGQFTLPETDVSIPGRGPGLTFGRTYNSGRLVDGPLGYGWTHNYDTRLSTFTHGEALVVDGTGRSDLYSPNGQGGYNTPPGHYATLVHNGDGTWTLTEKDQTRKTFSSAGKLTSLADSNGNSVSLSYSGGLLTQVSEPGGRSLSFGYTGQRITSITDPLSRTVGFGYSATGELTSTVDMRGKTWSYTYDSSHRMLTRVDPNYSRVLSNTYGTLGRVTKQSDALSNVTRFEYSAAGGSTAVYDPLDNKTSYGYDTEYRITNATDPYSKIVQYLDYDSGSNQPRRILDARKTPYNNTYFTYDSRGNTLTRKNGLNNIWSYGYDSFNNVISETNPLNYTTVYTYNSAGNLTETRNAKGQVTYFGRNSYGQLTSTTDGRGKVSAFGYDTYGNQITVTNPYSNSRVSAYDLPGRRTSVTDPLSHTTYYGYDANNNLTSTTDGRGKVTSFTYDNANNRLTATDPNVITTTFGYDQKNRLVTVTNALTGTTVYGYDSNDNLTSLRDANSHTRTFTYDKNNLLLTETDAQSKTTSYEYDGPGNRTKRVDANGAVVAYEYDTINRLTSVKHPTGTVTYGYNAADLGTSTGDSTGSTTYGYDELGRLSSATFPGSKVVAYQYDAAGNRTRITYPDGRVVDYTYDDGNRMATVTDWLTKTTSYTYDAASRLITTTFPTGVVEGRTYNEADQLLSVLNSKDGSGYPGFSYTLDNAGMRTEFNDSGYWPSETYTYDSLYRLTGTRYTDLVTQTYTYDSVGNRLSLVQGGNTITYTYDAGDRLSAAGAITYTYDNNGNQKSRTSGGVTTSYCWDVFDHLIRVADSSATSACPVDPVRLNSGGAAYVDMAGNNWAPDTFFTGGTAASTVSAIGNTTDDALYQAYRYGTATNPLTYTIPLFTAGTYTVTLKFNEPSKTAANQRKFDVSLEGSLALDDFDIYAAAGGRNIAVDRVFAVTANDGILNITFGRVVDNPIISAIEVV